MKRLLCILILSLFLLCGCRQHYYPCIRYHSNFANSDKNFEEVIIRDGYVLNQAHSYDIVDTENGYDIIFHIVKEGAE